MSAYFLVFAAVVLPCGALLDCYGPRLIDSALLLLAAGFLLFALADGVVTLVLGRALIGLGVAVGLMAGLKASAYPGRCSGCRPRLVASAGAAGRSSAWLAEREAKASE